ncbi:hypothetical protein RFA54_001610 [Vibrio vulnificus]|nr:hypothetical protein [Vibrio vulnificus]
MSESKKPLLIAKINQNLKLEQMNEIHEYLKNHLENLGIDLLVVNDKVEPQYHQPISELVDAIKAQTEAINQLALSNIEILDQLIPEQVDEQDEESGKDIEPQSLD